MEAFGWIIRKVMVSPIILVNLGGPFYIVLPPIQKPISTLVLKRFTFLDSTSSRVG